MGITITLDETVSERVAGISLAELTRYAQEGILSRLEQNGEGVRASEAAPLDKPWNEETISAVRDSMHEVEATGVTYSQEEVDEHLAATLARWRTARQK
jgi:hypothetical protein